MSRSVDSVDRRSGEGHHGSHLHGTNGLYDPDGNPVVNGFGRVIIYIFCFAFREYSSNCDVDRSLNILK